MEKIVSSVIKLLIIVPLVKILQVFLPSVKMKLVYVKDPTEIGTIIVIVKKDSILIKLLNNA